MFAHPQLHPQPPCVSLIVMRIETALMILATIPATHLVRPSRSCHEVRRASETTGTSAMNPTAAAPLAVVMIRSRLPRRSPS